MGCHCGLFHVIFFILSRPRVKVAVLSLPRLRNLAVGLAALITVAPLLFAEAQGVRSFAITAIASFIAGLVVEMYDVLAKVWSNPLGKSLKYVGPRHYMGAGQEPSGHRRRDPSQPSDIPICHNPNWHPVFSFPPCARLTHSMPYSCISMG